MTRYEIETLMEYINVKCAQACAEAKGEHIAQSNIDFAENQLLSLAREE